MNNPDWNMFLAFYKPVSSADFLLVNVATFDTSRMRSDEDLYDTCKRYLDSSIQKFGFGVVLIYQDEGPIITKFNGNPELEEDHQESDRFFFSDKKKFFDTLKDANE